MKKAVYLLLPAFVLCLLFTSCTKANAEQGDTSSSSETTTNAPETSNPVETTGTAQEPVFTTITPELDNAVYNEGETVLSVAWGTAEDSLTTYPVPDTQWKDGPQAFTVGEGGEIYIYDTYSDKLKVFENGRFVRSLDFSGVNDETVGISIFAMAEIGDSIYASDYLTNKIFKITGEEIVEMQVPRLAGIGEMHPTPNGYITAKEGQNVYIFDAEGNIVYNSGDYFVYSGEDGKILYRFDTSDMTGKFRLIDQNAECVSAVALATYTSQTDGSGTSLYVPGADIIGADAQGRVYLSVFREYSENFTLVRSENYILRLDVRDKTVKLIEIPVPKDETQAPIKLTGGGMFDMVTSDGSVYRAYRTTDDGVRIVRFSFD